MQSYRWYFIFIGFILTILSVILVNWYLTIEVRRVKQTIYATEQAIEQLNIDTVIEYVAEEYTDGWGFNQKTVYEFGKNIFTRTKSIEINIEQLEIEVDEQTAQANCEVQVKVVLTNEIYSSLELRDVFGTGKQKNKMMIRLIKSPANKWQIAYIGLVEEN